MKGGSRRIKRKVGLLTGGLEFDSFMTTIRLIQTERVISFWLSTDAPYAEFSNRTVLHFFTFKSFKRTHRGCGRYTRRIFILKELGDQHHVVLRFVSASGATSSRPYTSFHRSDGLALDESHQVLRKSFDRSVIVLRTIFFSDSKKAVSKNETAFF